MKQLDEYLSKNFKRIFWGLSGIFLVLYLALLGGDYVWVDESYTFAMIKHSFGEIWTITAADVHPPLYYWYLKIITAPFGYCMGAAKIASILPYMSIIIFGGMQAKKYFNERTSILFMGLFFWFPFTLSYSIEVRMYSLAAAFVFFCAVFAYKFYQDNGKWKDIIGLVISGVFAAYTHYFAFVSICIIYALLFIAIIAFKNNLLKKWLLLVIASIILYAPWLSSFIQQLIYKVDNEYWIDEITLQTIFSYIENLFGANGFAKYYWFFAMSYLICLIWILRTKENKDILLCICCLLVPLGTLAVGVLASIIVRPVFVIRYIIPSVPLLVAFMAIVLGKISSEALLSSILSVALIGGISNYGVILYQEYTNHNYLPIEEYNDVDAYIVINDVHIAGTLGYYVTDTSIYYGDSVSAANPYLNRLKIDDFNSDNINKAIILLDDGETIPIDYYDVYNAEYLGRWRCEYYTNAFLLTKK